MVQKAILHNYRMQVFPPLDRSTNVLNPKTKRSTISKSHKSKELNLSFPNSVHLHHGTKIFKTDYYKLQSNTNINSIVISLVVKPENSISFSIIIEKRKKKYIYIYIFQFQTLVMSNLRRTSVRVSRRNDVVWVTGRVGLVDSGPKFVEEGFEGELTG